MLRPGSLAPLHWPCHKEKEMSEKKSNTPQAPTRYSRQRGKKLPKELHIVNEHAAGIDIGSKSHYVSVAQSSDGNTVQHFGCLTPDLERMAQWLKKCRVTTVVMEATGVYWIPVFRILESHGMEAILVNPTHVKYVPGRKSDVSDCQWLRQLHTYGLLRAAFVPSQSVAAMRTYWRQRKELVQAASAEILHMQKALTHMNLQLHTVLSDISGVSGMKILRAIVAGERDPLTLAKLANSQVHRPCEEIAHALTGHYTDDQMFVLKQSLELFDIFHGKIQECDKALDAYLSKFESKSDANELPASPKPSKQTRRKNQPHFDLRTELYRLTGVDLTRIDGIEAMTAFTILSEIGFDISAFPNEHHFASWLGLCPNNRITGGNVKRRSTKHNYNRVADALRVAAQSLWRSKTYLGAYYRKFAGRLGAPKAITATAHKLARIVYRMLKYGEQYVDKGQEHLEKQHEERKLKSLIAGAKDLGYALINPKTGECLA